MRKIDGAILPTGAKVFIHPWGEKKPANCHAFMDQEGFEKIALRLVIVFKDAQSGMLLCRVGDTESDEVLRLLFEGSSGSAFWAYRS